MVRGHCRISYPLGLRARGLRVAQVLYRPHGGTARLFYNLWWRASVTTPILSLVRTKTPPLLGNIDLNELVREVGGRVSGSSDLLPILYYPDHGSQGKFRLMLVDAEERPVAFVKVGIDLAGGEAVEREIRAVLFLGNLMVKSFIFPSLVVSGTLGSAQYAAYHPIWEMRLGPSKWHRVHETVLSELRMKTSHHVRLVDMHWFGKGETDPWTPIHEVCRRLEPMEGYEHCAVHGDFAPWNFKVLDGKPLLLDWEASFPSAPFLADKLCFVLSLLGGAGSARLCVAQIRKMIRAEQRGDLALAFSWIRHARIRHARRFDENDLVAVAYRVLGLRSMLA